MVFALFCLRQLNDCCLPGAALKGTPNIIFHRIHHSFWRFPFNAFLRKIEGPPYTNGLLKKRDMIWDEYSIYGAFELDQVIFCHGSEYLSRIYEEVWLKFKSLRYWNRPLTKAKQILDCVRILTNLGWDGNSLVIIELGVLSDVFALLWWWYSLVFLKW